MDFPVQTHSDNDNKVAFGDARSASRFITI